MRRGTPAIRWSADLDIARLTAPLSAVASGSLPSMLLKALCILAVIFVAIGMVGIAIRRRRGL